MSDRLDAENVKQSFTYEKVIEIEEILEKKGIIKEFIHCMICADFRSN